MGHTEGVGRTHLNCKVAPDIKDRVIKAVKTNKEAASFSDYVSRCILYYYDERPYMRQILEQLVDRINVDNGAILQELKEIKARMEKLESPEGKQL